MSQRERRDAYSAKPEGKAAGDLPKWGVLAVLLSVVAILGALARSTVSPGVRGEWKSSIRSSDVTAKIRSMGENELWIYRSSGVFADVERRPGSKEVMVNGETNEDVDVRVWIGSTDNVTVEYRTDGKDFATIRLIGWMPDGTAEGAVILVPADDRRYYEFMKRELHDLRASYDNCPKCNPGKK